MRGTILVVEDDLNLGFLLVELLESAGHTVKLSRNGREALSMFPKNQFDLCLLDVMMPEMDGFETAELIRKKSANIPFLFLTARTLKADKMRGFALGAEDYITKPFDEDELLCRIQVILRRLSEEVEAPTANQFSIGAYSFDVSRQELTFQDKVKRLTEKETEVLRLLCLNKNQILKRTEAVEEIYGKEDYFLGRSFDVFISRIRKLLKEDPRISIENVFKVGFILNTPPESASASVS